MTDCNLWVHSALHKPIINLTHIMSYGIFKTWDYLDRVVEYPVCSVRMNVVDPDFKVDVT